jgi:protein ImuB
VKARPIPTAAAAPAALFPATPAPQAPARERTALTRVLPLRSAESAAELWAALHLPHLCGTQLTRLARCAQRFTPRVSLEPPDGLLLEVRGSLHLFGGVAGLRVALLKMCGELGLEARLAFAPTPLAALVMARAGKAAQVMERAELVGKLAGLALGTLRWPPEVIERLKLTGVRTIGAALRLPRAGFARRFGTAQLAGLDRLTGRTREVRTAFRPREAFRRRQDLSCEVESHAYLLSALERLLEELEDFLKVRQCGVMTVECRLLHRQAGMTPCVLRLAVPGADARHLGGLFAEEFHRLALPQAVRALELRAGRLSPLTPAALMLWQPGEHGGGAGSEAHALIERLQARLGEEAVHGLTLLDDHRPESCWAMTAPPPPAARTTPVARTTCGSAPPVSRRRPLWLLPMPQPLVMRAGRPWRRGLLQLVSEPERIETGWWDGEDIARDYYAALDIHGVRLWIFRERTAAHRWFLHGIFG